MEVYYKDLISEETTLEKLVDDLTCLVQGADEFVEAAGAALEPLKKEEIASRLARLKVKCQQLQKKARAGAVAADRVVREYPYWAAGLALVLGLATGRLLIRRRHNSTED